MSKTEAQSVVILSGPAASGKSETVKALIWNHGYRKISSSDHLKSLIGKDASREELISCGDRLDRQTDYAWVVDEVASPALTEDRSQMFWIFDSVRKPEQVDHFRRMQSARVHHIHISAPNNVLKERYKRRGRAGDQSLAYEHLLTNPNEMSARGLGHRADITIDTSETSSEAAAHMIHERVSSWSKSS